MEEVETSFSEEAKSGTGRTTYSFPCPGHLELNEGNLVSGEGVSCSEKGVVVEAFEVEFK